MNKSTISLALLASLFAGNAFAGEYTAQGYISEVKANIQGSVCDIMLTAHIGGTNIQGGRWDCDTQMGSNLLDIARTAHALNLKVDVVLEGNGAIYKPVYSINIVNSAN